MSEKIVSIASVPPRRRPRSWPEALAAIEDVLREVSRLAGDLGESEARALADRLGPLGIGMQLFAASLLEKHRPEPTLPFGGHRVYFARSVEGGPILIGTTVDVAHRLKDHAYRGRTSMRLLGWLPGDRTVVRALLLKFAAARIGASRDGGRFEPTPELLAYIEKETEHGDPDARRPGRRRRTSRRISLG